MLAKLLRWVCLLSLNQNWPEYIDPIRMLGISVPYLFSQLQNMQTYELYNSGMTKRCTLFWMKREILTLHNQFCCTRSLPYTIPSFTSVNSRVKTLNLFQQQGVNSTSLVRRQLDPVWVHRFIAITQRFVLVKPVDVWGWPGVDFTSHQH